MGKVLQLHQHGKGGYENTRGRIHKAILKGEDFQTGAMKGVSNPGWRWGRLDDKYRESVKQADYVVYSYSTPIAWHINPYSDTPPTSDDEYPGGYWVMPDDTYSPTTSRHQSIVRTALVLARVLPYDEDPSEQTCE